MKRIIAILAFFTLLGASAADLKGTVSFENGLYTYSYELSASEFPVAEVLVLVKSNDATFDLRPISFTSPAAWIFNTYVGANPNSEDILPPVTYFGWGLNGPGDTNAVSGFSFTTDAPPAANPVPLTYMLFAPGYQSGHPHPLLESFYLGSVVAPDFLVVPPPVPELQTYVMLLAGLGMVGYAFSVAKLPKGIRNYS